MDSIEASADKHVAIHEVLLEAYDSRIRYLEEHMKLSSEIDIRTEFELVEKLIGLAWQSNYKGKPKNGLHHYRRAEKLLAEMSKAHDGVLNFTVDAPNGKPVIAKEHLALRKTFVMNNIGNCLSNMGAVQKAIDQHEKTLKLRESLLDRFPDSFEAKRQVGVSLANLTDLYFKTGDMRQGNEFEARDFHFQRELWQQHPDLRWIGLNLSNSLANAARRKLERGELDGATPLFSEAYELRKKIYFDAVNNVESTDGLGAFNFADKYATSAYEFAAALLGTKFDEGQVQELIDESTNLLSELFRDYSENLGYRLRYSKSLETYSSFLLIRNNLDDATKKAELANLIAIEAPKKEPNRVTRALRAQAINTSLLIAICYAHGQLDDEAKRKLVESINLTQVPPSYKENELGFLFSHVKKLNRIIPLSDDEFVNEYLGKLKNKRLVKELRKIF